MVCDVPSPHRSFPPAPILSPSPTNTRLTGAVRARMQNCRAHIAPVFSLTLRQHALEATGGSRVAVVGPGGVVRYQEALTHNAAVVRSKAASLVCLLQRAGNETSTEDTTCHHRKAAGSLVSAPPEWLSRRTPRPAPATNKK